MKLNAAQVDEFDNQNYLFFPGLLDGDKVGAL